MTDVWIFDIDGTLSNDAHRRYFLKKTPKDWNSFYSDLMNDSPFDPVFRILNMISFNFDSKVIFITGRTENYRETTLNWIKKNTNAFFDESDLYMRAEYDRRDDTIIKLEIVNNFLEKNSNHSVRAIFEDRTRVVDMWRRNGYYVFDCNQTREEF